MRRLFRALLVRAAIQEGDAEPAGSTIDVTVPAGKYTLSLGPLSFTANTIDVTGASTTATVVKQTTSSSHQLVNVAANATATLSALELTKGAPVGKTGGALVNSGTTTLDQVLVTKNVSAAGGGLTNNVHASLTLTNSTVTQNSILFPANNKQGGPAGGILNAGTLTVTGSTISDNDAGSGGYGSSNPGGTGGSGGGIDNSGNVVVDTSTITGNVAGSGGLGLESNEPSGPGGNGGGIYSSKGSVTVTDSVISTTPRATPDRPARPHCRTPATAVASGTPAR